MIIFDKFIDEAGYYRVLVGTDTDYGVITLKFKQDPSDAEAFEKAQRVLDVYLLDKIEPIQWQDTNLSENLYEVVQLIRDNPSVTLNQYNNYLNGLPWYESSGKRYAVFVMAKVLSERKDVELSDFTESEILSKLKTFILNASISQLKRIVYGISNL